MSYSGSWISRLKLRFQLMMDAIERRAPWADWATLWLGIFLTVTGAGVTWFHGSHPGASLTEDVVQALGSDIRTVHSWLPWPVADAATYAGVPLAALSLVTIVVRRLNRRGSTTRRQ